MNRQPYAPWETYRNHQYASHSIFCIQLILSGFGIFVAVPPRQNSEQGIEGKVYGCRHFPNAGSNWEAIEKLRLGPTAYIRISLRKWKDSEEILEIYFVSLLHPFAVEAVDWKTPDPCLRS